MHNCFWNTKNIIAECFCRFYWCQVSRKKGFKNNTSSLFCQPSVFLNLYKTSSSNNKWTSLRSAMRLKKKRDEKKRMSISDWIWFIPPFQKPDKKCHISWILCFHRPTCKSLSNETVAVLWKQSFESAITLPIAFSWINYVPQILHVQYRLWAPSLFPPCPCWYRSDQRLNRGVNWPLWHTDRAALFAADHNNRTSVRRDHLFSWLVDLLIGLLMRREWAGAKSQTNEEETHKRTNKQAGVGMCFSTICVCACR